MQPYGNTAVAGIEPGDHLCVLYETEQQQQELLTSFIRSGLEQGQKVLYIVDSHTADVILAYLEKVGMKTAGYMDSGQLSILTLEGSYLREGSFDPDAMIGLLQREERRALEEGYSALRVTGEMTWVLRGLPGSERFIEYEAKLNDYFPGSRALALCQYDRWAFDARLLLDVVVAHPIVVLGTEIYDNFYYVPPGGLTGKADHSFILDQRIRQLKEHKRLGQALLKSEKLYRTIFNAGNDAILVYGLDAEGLPGSFIEVNDRACELLGYGREKLMKLNRMDLEEPKSLEELRDRFRTLLEKKQGLHETNMVTKQGKSIPVEISSNLVDLEGQQIVLSIARDITIRKRGEAALRRSEERFSQAFNANPLAICIVTIPEGRFIDANPAYERLTGFARQELIGHTTLELGLVPSLDKREEMIEGLLEQGGFLGFETQLQSHDGKVLQLKAHVVVIELEDERCALTMLEPRDAGSGNEAWRPGGWS
jgi:PAS domain S-box-containing protein